MTKMDQKCHDSNFFQTFASWKRHRGAFFESTISEFRVHFLSTSAIFIMATLRSRMERYSLTPERPIPKNEKVRQGPQNHPEGDAKRNTPSLVIGSVGESAEILDSLINTQRILIESGVEVLKRWKPSPSPENGDPPEITFVVSGRYHEIVNKWGKEGNTFSSRGTESQKRERQFIAQLRNAFNTTRWENCIEEDNWYGRRFQTTFCGW